MRLLLIRHGDPDYEHDSLTNTGKQEAQYLAERLAKEKIDACFVSTMGRARATAEPSLRALGMEAEPCDWLREFSVPIDRPDVDGLISIPWDWLPQDWLRDPLFLQPDAWRENEVFRSAGVGEAYDRVISQFDALLAKHGYTRDGRLYRVSATESETLALFCHLGLSCVLLSHLLNCSPMVLWHGLAMAPSSVTTVYSEERRPGLALFRAAAIGDVSHLYVKGAGPSFACRFCENYGNGDRID